MGAADLQSHRGWQNNNRKHCERLDDIGLSSARFQIRSKRHSATAFVIHSWQIDTSYLLAVSGPA